MSEREGRSWRLGEILVQNGWITWDQLERALELQQAKTESMSEILVQKGLISTKEGQALNLGEILIRNGWISWEELKEGLEIQRRSGRIIGEILVQMRFVSEKNLYHALAIQFNKAFVDFERIKIESDVLKIVHRRIAYQYRIMPLLIKDRTLLVAIADPKNAKALSEIGQLITDYEIMTAIACPTDIENALRKYYGPE